MSGLEREREGGRERERSKRRNKENSIKERTNERTVRSPSPLASAATFLALAAGDS